MSEAKNLRIVYMGTPDFAVEPLRRLVEGGYNVVAVVTVADKPSGRGLQVNQSAVKRYAVECGLPVLQPVLLRSEEFVDSLRALDADLGIVVAFRMLPEVVWSMPRLGTFNLHASLLPRYRGAAPINWAIINGDQKTGITTFFLNQQIDCGEVIMRQAVAIGDTMTAGELHDELMVLGGELVVSSVEAVASGIFVGLAQNDELATAAPKIFKEDCKVDWDGGVVSIYNKIRGLSPYPAAWFEVGGTTAKIFGAHYVFYPAGSCASTVGVVGVVESDGRSFLRVAAMDGWVYIDRIQLAGKRAMDIEEFLRGNKLEL